MATCEHGAAPSALDWLAARRRWLALLVAALILASLIGGIVIAAGWLERTVWLAGGIIAVAAAAWVDQWRYDRFLAGSDRAWIANLRAPLATTRLRRQYQEMRERLGTGWARNHRGRELGEAIAACLAWIDANRATLPAGERRSLAVLMCDAVQDGAGAMAAPDAARCLSQVRLLLIDLDRGRIDAGSAEDS